MSIEHVERVLNLKVVTNLQFMRAIRICNSVRSFRFQIDLDVLKTTTSDELFLSVSCFIKFRTTHEFIRRFQSC
jgi:hypothetical protein